MKNPIKKKDKKKKSTSRVGRGGGWDRYAQRLRVADRLRFGPSFRLNFLGFRIVRNKDEKSSL